MSTIQLETYDCASTLTDSEVLDFCKNGYLLLEAVVDDEVNRRTTEYLETDSGHEPTGILDEEWFVNGVMVNPAAAGAVRSLLGTDFHLPVLMSNHRVQCPEQAVGGWHVDGNYDFALEINNLQVFYYPQDTPAQMGPTQVLPGSHLVHNKARFMSHFGGLRGQASTAAPAGSIFLTMYHIWHRRGPSTATGLRNMLKYFYWRTTAPKRDWIREEGFDFATANYQTPTRNLLEQFRGNVKVAEMFLWLCGQRDAFQNLGGQSWPLPGNRRRAAYGYPQLATT